MGPHSSDSAELRRTLLRPARPWGLIALLAALVTGFLLSWHSLTDIDVWFHLRSGRDILAGMGFPQVNTYAFTEPDHPWLNHEWLFQVGIAWLGPEGTPSAGDPPVTGWNVLRTILALALVGGLAWAVGLFRRMQGASPGAAAWTGVVLLAGLGLLWPRLTLRPELVSYLLLVLVVEALTRFAAGSDRPARSGPAGFLMAPPAGILLICLVWAQCHGFAALAPVLIALAAILAPLDRRWRRSSPAPSGPTPRAWAILVAGSLLALALTPNGLRGLLFPFRALGQFGSEAVDLRRTVSELVPLLRSPGTLDWTIKLWVGSVAWGVLWTIARWRAVSLLRILLFAAAAVAAYWSQRNIGLYAVAFVLLHAPSAGPPAFSLGLRRPGFLKPSVTALGGLGLVVVISGLWWPALTSDRFYLHEGVGRRFGGGVNPARYPAAAAAEMAARRADRWFANLDGAAFVLARAPGRTFIDGRTEAYSPGHWRDYLTLKEGGEPALAILTRHRVDAVCLTTGSGSFDMLERALFESPAWDLAAADGGGLLFVPDGEGTKTDPAAILAAAAEDARRRAGSGSATRRADHLVAASRLDGLARDGAADPRLLEEARALAPGHPVVLHNLANLRMARQDFAVAADLFAAALQANPRQASSALNAGVCLSRQGDRAAARRFFRRTVGIDPEMFEAWMNLAVTEAALGDRGAAREAARRARDLRPDDPNARALVRRLGG